MQNNYLDSYPSVARFLHWAIAAMIIFNLLSGMVLAYFEDWSHQVDLFGLHKQIGMLILILVSLRIIWRLTHTYPSLDALPLPGYEKKLAQLGHIGLYVLMFCIPVSGFFFSQSASRDVYLLWLKLPRLIAGQDRIVVLQLLSVHKYLSVAIAVLIAIHIFAVIKHHLVDQLPIIRRMLPKGR